MCIAFNVNKDIIYKVIIFMCIVTKRAAMVYNELRCFFGTPYKIEFHINIVIQTGRYDDR